MIENAPADQLCSRCGERRSVEEFSVDRGRTSGRKNTCKRCDAKKSLEYYYAHRDQVREKQQAKRGRPRSPELTECTECGKPLEGRQRVICGSEACRDRRFRRLHPEAYAERERRKAERRREARRRAREAKS